MTNTTQITDIAIIGAGPVGLFGVFAAGMLGLSSSVFDSLPDIGGQCTALYPDKPIYDIPAYPKITGADLIGALEAQAAPFSPIYHLGAAVIDITENPDKTWSLTNAKGIMVTARSILIACGAGAFGPNRPPIEGVQQYENKSVFYAVRSPEKFTGKRIAIAGGGDSAVDWANILADIADKVYVIHRRDNFRAAPENIQRMEAHVRTGKIKKIIPFQLDSLNGTDGYIQTVRVRDTDDNIRTLDVDTLLCFFGLVPNLGILGNIDLAIDGNHIMTDPTTGATNRPGIFAAGDGVIYTHKQKLILTGFAEISQAAHAIYAHLNPGRNLHHVHSTTRGIPVK